jgi:polyketide biosynthesis enoyl-CoA hydratase PksH
MSRDFATLRVTARGPLLDVVLDRPDRANALTRGMIAELHVALDLAEAGPDCRLLALSGAGETFCSGMDFAEAAASGGGADSLRPAIEAFYDLMARFTTSSVMIAATITGRVTAGGVGLAAAADHVIAGPQASFQLSEVIFGLLPATVAPFVARRCGLHPAYRLALSAQRIDAARALAIGLVDEVTEAPADALRHCLIRASRLRPDCVAALKGLFRDIGMINAETRRVAVDAISGQIMRPETTKAIRRFMQDQSPPWKP